MEKIKLRSLSDLNSKIPRGRVSSKPTVEECRKNVFTELKYAIRMIRGVESYVDKYPKLKDDIPENYWLVKSSCPCCEYTYKGEWYAMNFRWIFFEELKDFLETLSAEPFWKEYRQFLDIYRTIRHDDSDEYSKIYRYKELKECIYLFNYDLRALSDNIYEYYHPKRRYDDDDDDDDEFCD